MVEPTRQRRRFEGKPFDYWGEYPTVAKADTEKNKLIKEGWATTGAVTKSTRPGDKTPFKLWLNSDPSVSWNKLKAKILPQVDKELRAVITELNDNGVFSVESCSGHQEKPARLWMYRETFSEPKFMKILKKHGMEDIKRRSQYDDSNRDTIYFTFDLPGDITYKRDQKRVVRPRAARPAKKKPIISGWGF